MQLKVLISRDPYLFAVPETLSNVLPRPLEHERKRSQKRNWQWPARGNHWDVQAPKGDFPVALGTPRHGTSRSFPSSSIPISAVSGRLRCIPSAVGESRGSSIASPSAAPSDKWSEPFSRWRICNQKVIARFKSRTSSIPVRELFVQRCLKCQPWIKYLFKEK